MSDLKKTLCYSDILKFYKGRKVLLTGHTGFKGTWMLKVLELAGADVCGYSQNPPTNPALFEIIHAEKLCKSVIGDIRDYNSLKKCFDEFQPEIVIHMAAQPIVRTSYKEPLYTYETNVMGTANLMECVRLSASVRSVVNVTTDKVYLNDDRDEGFTEDMPLDGFDPYSNSKSCSELVTHSYRSSFFGPGSGREYTAISTCRAGNVIGGGDFAKDRIIPDCIRAAAEHSDIIVRNPYSTRPYQHVLEPVFAYLMVAARQYSDVTLASSYNVGPDDTSAVTTGEIADMFCKAWGDGAKWINRSDGGPHEAKFLKLDCTKLKNTFGWAPKWTVEDAVEKTVEAAKVLNAGGDAGKIMEKQIMEYENV